MTSTTANTPNLPAFTCTNCGVDLGAYPGTEERYEPRGVHIFERSADRRMAVLFTDADYSGLQPLVLAVSAVTDPVKWMSPG